MFIGLSLSTALYYNEYLIQEPQLIREFIKMLLQGQVDLTSEGVLTTLEERRGLLSFSIFRLEEQVLIHKHTSLRKENKCEILFTSHIDKGTLAKFYDQA